MCRHGVRHGWGPDRCAHRRLQRGVDARIGARSTPSSVPIASRSRPDLRRRERRRDLHRRPRVPGHCRHADHRDPPRGEPRLRGQSEGGIPVGAGPPTRRRCPASRGRPVRAGSDRTAHRAARRRPGRRRVRLPTADTGRGTFRGHADVQVPRQPHPEPVREHDGRHEPQRVAQRLSGLPGRRPQ